MIGLKLPVHLLGETREPAAASGRAVAEKIYERHTTLEQFFIRIGVDEKTALEDACKVEHYISDTTFERIKAFAQTEQI